MGAREKLEKRIEEKQSEVWNLRRQIRDAEVFIEALKEALHLLPKESVDDGPITLRPGTNVDKARLALLAKGTPMHITELLKAVGKPDDNDSRAALSGSISAYVRKNQIFTRPAPNTFSLIEFPLPPPKATGAPPPNFGSDKTNVEPEIELELDIEPETVGITDDDVPF